MTHDWATGIVGKDQFIYKYLVYDEVPLVSVWVMQFFGCAWSSGTVIPKKESENDAAHGVESAETPFYM